MSKFISVKDISKPSKQLAHVEMTDLIPLPPPYDDVSQYNWGEIKEQTREECECSLDDTVVLNLPKPKTKKEEDELVRKFLSGLEKLFTPNNNWTFLQQLTLSMDHCAKCNTCSDACPVYEGSGNNPIYRPNYRSEVLRRIYTKYIKPGGRFYGRWTEGDIDLNWTTLARLAELSYRCTICRRCALTCPVGVDNGLINHEIRKIFSMELGIAAKEIHTDGSMLQLKVGSSTGMSAIVVKDNIEFIDEDMEDLTGIHVETPWDKEGADVLLIHNAGEILAWPDNPGAFALILQAAGISWTLSSELAGYDGINYGLWYDDAQFARVAIKHAEAAKKLGVKKIVIGECGHAGKSLMVIADRILNAEYNVRRESAMTLMEEIVFSGKIKFDPMKNDFPVTLHDPCNLVRLSGIVEPQRRILRYLAPQFREMTPHGVENYCCGGGSGFAIMGSNNFPDWRNFISSRKKFAQILDAFSDCMDPSIHKYVCAPCSNCKGAIRDMLHFYNAWEKSSIIYDGLVELIVNAMVDIKEPFIKWEWH